VADLTTVQFQAFMLDVLKRFSSDWSDHRASEPAVFPAAQPDVEWWEAFSEFAHAEILNTRIRAPKDERDAV
jgi:hypothetical protein